jgi:hypothetical protein
MVKKIGAWNYVRTSSLNIGYAAEPELYTCAYWPQLTPLSKRGYVFGWVVAVDSIARFRTMWVNSCGQKVMESVASCWRWTMHAINRKTRNRNLGGHDANYISVR